MGEKRCYRCRVFLPLTSFHRDRTRVDGRQAACVMCNSERNDGRERSGVGHSPEQYREYNATRAHGISRSERDAMYLAQSGCCLGCDQPFADADLQVDHDHECCRGKHSCGKCVRGLLCAACNCRDALAKVMA